MSNDDLQEHWVNSYLEKQEKIEKDFEKFSGRNKIIIYRTIFLSMFIVVIGDLISSLDNYAMTHDWFYTQMVTGFSSQITWLCMSFLFVNADNKRQRIVIGLSQAVGAGIGSSLMLKFVKPYIISLF